MLTPTPPPPPHPRSSFLYPQTSALLDVVQQINLGRDIAHWMPSVVSRGLAVGAPAAVRKLTYHVATACTHQLARDDGRRLRLAAVRDLLGGAKGGADSRGAAAAAAATQQKEQPVEVLLYALRFLCAQRAADLRALLREDDGRVALRRCAAHTCFKVREEAFTLLACLAADVERAHLTAGSSRASAVSAFLGDHLAAVVQGVGDGVDSVAVSAFSALRQCLLCADPGSLRPHAYASSTRLDVSAARAFAPFFFKFLARAAAMAPEARAIALLPLTYMTLLPRRAEAAAGGSGGEAAGGSEGDGVMLPQELAHGFLQRCLSQTHLPALAVEAARCVLLVAESCSAGGGGGEGGGGRMRGVDPAAVARVLDALLFVLETAFSGGISADSVYAASVLDDVLRALAFAPPPVQVTLASRLLGLLPGVLSPLHLLPQRVRLVVAAADLLLRASSDHACAALRRQPAADDFSAIFSELLRLSERGHPLWLLKQQGAGGLSAGGAGGAASAPNSPPADRNASFADSASVAAAVAAAAAAEAGDSGRVSPQVVSPASSGQGSMLYEEAAYCLCSTAVRLHEEAAVEGEDGVDGRVVRLAAWCGMCLQVGGMCVALLATSCNTMAAPNAVLKLFLQVQRDGLDALEALAGKASPPMQASLRGAWLPALHEQNRRCQKDLAQIALDVKLQPSASGRAKRSSATSKVVLLCTVSALMPDASSASSAGRAPSAAASKVPDEVTRLVAFLSRACQTLMVGEKETISLALFDSLLQVGASRGGDVWAECERAVEAILRDATKSATAPQILLAVTHKLDALRRLALHGRALGDAELAACGLTAFSEHHPVFHHDMSQVDAYLVSQTHEAVLDVRTTRLLQAVKRPAEDAHGCAAAVTAEASTAACHSVVVTSPDDPVQVLTSYTWHGATVDICLEIANMAPVVVQELRVTIGCRGDITPMHIPRHSEYYGVDGAKDARKIRAEVSVQSRSDTIRRVWSEKTVQHKTHAYTHLSTQLHPGETVEIVRTFAVATLTPGMGFSTAADFVLAASDQDEGIEADDTTASNTCRVWSCREATPPPPTYTTPRPKHTHTHTHSCTATSCLFLSSTSWSRSVRRAPTLRTGPSRSCRGCPPAACCTRSTPQPTSPPSTRTSSPPSSTPPSQTCPPASTSTPSEATQRPPPPPPLAPTSSSSAACATCCTSRPSGPTCSPSPWPCWTPPLPPPPPTRRACPAAQRAAS